MAAALVFSCGSTVFDVLLAEMGIIYATTAVHGLLLVFIITKRTTPARFLVWIKICAPIFLLAIVNVAISVKPQESFARWIFFFIVIFNLVCLSRSVSAEEKKSIEAWLPYCFLSFIIPLLAIVFFFGERVEIGRMPSAKWVSNSAHLAGYYANMLCASAIFIRNVPIRITLLVIGLTVVFLSGSRGAMITTTLGLIPAALFYARRSKLVMPILLTGVCALVAVMSNENLVDYAFGQKARESGRSVSGVDHFLNSADDRKFLREYGYSLLVQNPLGMGLGNTFTIATDKDRGSNLHNGLLNLSVEVGVFGGLVYVATVLLVTWYIAMNKAIPAESRYFFFSILVVYALRSLTEDYHLLNLANFPSQILILLILLNARSLWSENRHRSV